MSHNSTAMSGKPKHNTKNRSTKVKRKLEEWDSRLKNIRLVKYTLAVANVTFKDTIVDCKAVPAFWTLSSD